MHSSHHQRSVSTCGPNSCNGGAKGIGVPKNNAYTFLWKSSHFSLNDKGLKVGMDEAVCNHLNIVCIQMCGIAHQLGSLGQYVFTPGKQHVWCLVHTKTRLSYSSSCMTNLYANPHI